MSQQLPNDTKDEKKTDIVLKRYCCWYNTSTSNIMMGVVAFHHPSKAQLDLLSLDHVRVWCMTKGLLPLGCRIAFRWCSQLDCEQNGYISPVASFNSRATQLARMMLREEETRSNMLTDFMLQLKHNPGAERSVMLDGLKLVLHRQSSVVQKWIDVVTDNKAKDAHDQSHPTTFNVYYYDSLQGTSMLFDRPQLEVGHIPFLKRCAQRWVTFTTAIPSLRTVCGCATRMLLSHPRGQNGTPKCNGSARCCESIRRCKKKKRTCLRTSKIPFCILFPCKNQVCDSCIDVL